jgi:hypothetical protein
MAERTWRATLRQGWALAPALLGLGLAAARARAADSTGLVVLEWVAPRGCPDAAYVEGETKRLAPGLGGVGGPYLRAHAEVGREKSGLWRVEIQTTGPEGTGRRTVTAESCSALADAAALILALAIDPDRAAATRTATEPASQAPAPSPSASTAATASNTPSAPSPAASTAATSSNTPTRLSGPPAPTVSAPANADASAPAEATSSTSVEDAASRRGFGPQSASRWALRFAVSASAVLDSGTLPTAAPGFAVTLGVVPVAFSPLRFELGAGQFLDESTTQSPARSGTFSLRTFDAGECLVAKVGRVGRVEVGGCTNVELAWLSAAGLYESVTSQGAAVWWVLRARVTAAYAWSRAWAIRADVGGGFDVTQPEFVSSGAEQGLIHRPARYTARGALGLEVRF